MKSEFSIKQHFQHGLADSLKGGFADIVEVVVDGVPGEWEGALFFVYADDVDAGDATAANGDVIVGHFCSLGIDEVFAIACFASYLPYTADYCRGVLHGYYFAVEDGTGRTNHVEVDTVGGGIVVDVTVFCPVLGTQAPGGSAETAVGACIFRIPTDEVDSDGRGVDCDPFCVPVELEALSEADEPVRA